MTVDQGRVAEDKPDVESVPLLDIADLTVGFHVRTEDASMPLQGVNLRVPRATRMALVGESGSGKSLTAAAVIGLLPKGAEIKGPRYCGDPSGWTERICSVPTNAGCGICAGDG